MRTECDTVLHVFDLLTFRLLVHLTKVEELCEPSVVEIVVTCIFVTLTIKTLFMKSRSKLVTICLLTTALAACNSDQLDQREAALKEKELELRQREQELENKGSDTHQENYSSNGNSYSEPQTTVKYMYVVVSTNEPKIISETVEDLPDVDETPSNDPPPGESFTDGILPREVKPHFLKPPKLPRYVKYAQPQHYTYTSDIVEVKNYTEDARLMEEDKYERKVQPTINEANRRIEFDNRMSSGKSVNAVAEIISRKSFVFDTYAEASKDRATRKNITQ